MAALGNKEEVLASIYNGIINEPAFKELSNEQLFQFLSNIQDVLKAGLGLPGKTRARALIENVLPFNRDYNISFMDFHYDPVMIENDPTVPVRALQILSGAKGLYINECNVDQELALKYKMDRDALKLRIVTPFLCIRDQQERKSRVKEALEPALIDFDHNSEFFKSLDHEQLKYLESGEVLFFRAESSSNDLIENRPRALGHFLPISTSPRLRIMFDFFGPKI
jgi:hypothetical protein